MLVDAATVDVIKGVVERVAEVLVNGGAVVRGGGVRAPGSGRKIVLEGPA